MIGNSIFISYASPDRERVTPFFERLEKEGLNVWMDSKRLLPGQSWEFEIDKEIDGAAVIIVFVSKSSVTRRGFVQAEMRRALRNREQRLQDDIYIVPVLLDTDVEVPEAIRGIQHVKASDPDCVSQLLRAVNGQLGRLAGEKAQKQRTFLLEWDTERVEESWEGFPGYEFRADRLKLRSSRFHGIQRISEYIGGGLYARLFSLQQVRFEQEPDAFGESLERYVRTSTVDVRPSEPVLEGGVLSLLDTSFWYGAGAMHPNQMFESYVFCLDPLIRLPNPGAPFANPTETLGDFRESVRDSLRQSRKSRASDGDDLGFDEEWLERGTEDWDSFRAYRVVEGQVEVMFAPYQVDSYAAGAHVARVPLGPLRGQVRGEILEALTPKS